MKNITKASLLALAFASVSAQATTIVYNVGTLTGLGSVASTYSLNANVTGARAAILGGNWSMSVNTSASWSQEATLNLETTSGSTVYVGEGRTTGGTNNATPVTLGGALASWDNANGTYDLTTGTSTGNYSGATSFQYRQSLASAGDVSTLTNATVSFMTDVITPMSSSFGPTSGTYSRATSLTAASTSLFNYTTSTFTLASTDNYYVGATYKTPAGAGFDGWLSVYKGAFNPLTPLANLVAVDDDGRNGTSEGNSGIYANFSAGNYTMVYTSYTADTTFAASVVGYVAGGAVSTVPEPASMLVLGLGLVGFLARRRRS